MTKAEAIRIASKDNLNWTNEQIKEEVKRQFGLIVSSNSIINAIGSHRKRTAMIGHSPYLAEKANEFLRLVGDYYLARQLLALAEATT